MFEVTGQSFLYNQIRKMIGFVIYSFKAQRIGLKAQNSEFKAKTQNTIKKCEKIFDKNVVLKIPIAPSLGLFLKNVSFEKHFLQRHENENLMRDWSKKSDCFIDNKIIPQICEKEINDGNFADWMNDLDGYLNI